MTAQMTGTRVHLKDLDDWDRTFSNFGLDVWDVLDNAIDLAARNYPVEFKRRRDVIAERLFTAHLCQKSSSLHTGSAADADSPCLANSATSPSGSSPASSSEDGDRFDKPSRIPTSHAKFEEAELKGLSTSGVTTLASAAKIRPETAHHLSDERLSTPALVSMEPSERLQSRGGATGHLSNRERDSAAQVAAEMEEAKRTTAAVERVKRRLQAELDSSDGTSFGSVESLVLELRSLEDLPMTLSTLQTTQIGKPVNAFRKHPSPEVRAVAKRLVRLWKDVVSSCLHSAQAIAGAGPDDDDDDSPLASPPIDACDLLSAPHMSSLEVANFLKDSEVLNIDPVRASNGPDRSGSAYHPDPEYHPSAVSDYQALKRQAQINAARGSGVCASRGGADAYGGGSDGFTREGRDGRRSPLPVRAREDATATGRGAAGGARNPGAERNGNHHFSPADSARANLAACTTPRHSAALEQGHRGGAGGDGRSLGRPSPATGGRRGEEPPVTPPLGAGHEGLPDSITARLDAAKRRLHEHYQDIESAKKARALQVVAPKDVSARKRHKKLR